MFIRRNKYSFKKLAHIPHILLSRFKKNDITVVAAVKNRCDYRIENMLRSIRNQDYPQDLIHITIVDYDSKKEFISQYQSICAKFRARYIRVDNRLLWSRGRALNIGIKRAETKYILSCDIDIILEKNYIRVALNELLQNPYRAVYCSMLDAPQGCINGIIDVAKEYYLLKKKCAYRGPSSKFPFGISIICALTFFFYAVRGYDEKYLLWGSEDKDLVERFGKLGLNIVNIKDKTSYIHQWHEKYEGVKEINEFEAILKNNRLYRETAHSIMRNSKRWGETEET